MLHLISLKGHPISVFIPILFILFKIVLLCFKLDLFFLSLSVIIYIIIEIGIKGCMHMNLKFV